MKHVLASALLLVLATACSARADADLRPWEALVVQDSGRRKPAGTLGHEALVKIAGRDPVTLKDGQSVAGTAFAFSMFYATRDWRDEPVILVGYRPLAARLGLDPARKRFSRQELQSVEPALRALSQQAAAMRQTQPDQPVPRINTEAQAVIARTKLFDALGDTSGFLIAPPPAGSPAGSPWLGVEALLQAYPPEQVTPIIQRLRDINVAYGAGDSDALARAVSEAGAGLRALRPEVYPSKEAIDRELLYNRMHPFDIALWVFVAAFLLVAAGQRHGPRRWLLRAGEAATLAGLAALVCGIALRVMIAGRAPVTNMYESVIWVSMGTAFFALIFYAIYRNRLMLLSALPLSCLCLLLARSLPVAMPSRLDPLVPVLRDNFWLTIHVLTITLSYAAFALALGFAHVVLWQYIRRPGAAPAMRQLHTWLYRMMFVGLILLAAGTILGGVWANYSWGRFWGWDPKETWAFIALLMYVVAIHGKMAGWWGDFGIAVAAVVNFSGVVMAWYGVNYVLGAGLHSYGFGVGGEPYIIAFLIAEAAYVGLAVVRHRMSAQARTELPCGGDASVR